MTSNADWKIYFEKLLSDDLQKSVGLATIETMMKTLSESKETSVHGLTCELNQTLDQLLSTNESAASIQSAADLFLRFILLLESERKIEFFDLMDVYKKRGAQLIRRISQSRSLICNFALPFIQHNAKILIHSYSKVVLAALLEAKKHGHVFHTFVTESAPDFAGKKMHAVLTEHGIDSTLILDSAVGYLMERLDAVVFGAEAVMENGGIINKIGSAGIAIVAKALNKDVYVLAESIKFCKEFPLNQRDIPEKFKYRASTLQKVDSNNLKVEHPCVDYVHPRLINLLITDIGIFDPALISSQLLKLYS